MEGEERIRGREKGKERGGRPGGFRRRGQGKGVGSVWEGRLWPMGLVEQKRVILGIMVLM